MKLKEFFKSITKNKYRVALLKGLAGVCLILAISAVSVHYLTGDTLSEYANNNPELAYPAVEAIEPESSSESDTAEENPVEEISEASGEDTPEIINDNTSKNTSESPEESSPEADTVTEPAESLVSTLNISSVNIGPMIHFYAPTQSSDGYLSINDDVTHPNRTNYDYGFYYEPLSEEVINYITGISYPTADANPQVSLSELRYVGILYYDFNGIIQAGELICNEYIANDLVEIFCELYKSEYQFEKVVLVDNYGGDDTASITADNTSCFNYRVVEGKTTLSKHAYGLAIDLNPFYNPYLVFGGNEDGSDYISPAGSEIYIDRSQNFPYKIDENDLLYKLFIAHGFTWGGNWNSCKDYQHFQKTK